MSQWWPSVVLVLVSATLVVGGVACGDDDGLLTDEELAVAEGAGGSTSAGNASGGGASGDAASGAAGGAASGGGAAGSSGNAADARPDAGTAGVSLPCNPTGSGACQSETDCPAMDSGAAAEGAQQCSACAVNAESTACWQSCLGDSAGLSDACTTCFAGLADCALYNCALACLDDARGDSCRQCQIDAHCSPAFEACSGVPAP